jgi:hypothetical protein
MTANKRANRWLTLVPLLAAGAVAQDAMAYAPPAGLGAGDFPLLGGIPGDVPDAGAPNFFTGANLTFSKVSGGYKLTGTKSGSTFTFNQNSSTGWNVSNATFDFKANFNSVLGLPVFNSNGSYVSIKGRIPTYNGAGSIVYDGSTASGFQSTNVKTTTGQLYRADLIDMGADLNPIGLGFTTDASDDWGWASQFMTGNESVWFYLLSNTTFGGKTHSTSIWDKCLQEIASNKKSSWSITFNNVGSVTTVPVPAAVWLFGSALAGMGLFGRRSKETLAA